MRAFSRLFHFVLISAVLIVGVRAAEKNEKLTWGTEDWNGNNAAYQNLKRALDNQSDAQRDRYIREQQKKAVKKKSSLDQFGWAYASWLKRKKTDKLNDQFQLMLPVRNNFSFVSNPRTYEYTRVRFLVEAWIAPRPQYKEVGRRLLRRSANDYDVKSVMVKVLEIGSSNEWNMALSYAKDLVKLQPKNPKSHSLLGSVYFNSWNKSKDPAKGRAAIAAYKEYLRLAPPNAEWRPQAEHLIKYISDRL